MNKKILFGTTALVAAGFVATDAAQAADPLRLEIRGYRNEFFSFGDINAEDGTDYNTTGHFSDGEVQFRGVTTLDNGISIGVQVELEAYSTGDQIDENYAFLEGGFGRLVVGSENTGPYQTFWSVTAPYVGAPINSGWITVFIPRPAGNGLNFRHPGLSTNLDISNDDNGVTYYSPRFAGFQLAASYVPTLLENGEGKNFPVEANTDTEYHDGFAVGLHYTNSFGGFDVSAAGAYGQASRPDGAPFDTVAGLGDYGDQQFVKGGLTVGFGGFSIGGSFGYEFEGRIAGVTTQTTGISFPAGATFGVTTPTYTANAASSTKGFSYDVGVSYSNGPWAIGATYFHGQQEGTVFNNDFHPSQGTGTYTLGSKDDQELQAINVGLSYTLGPGISANAGVMWAKYNMEDNVGFVSGEAPGESPDQEFRNQSDTDGVVGYVGLKIGY
jgi:outer membrane protein OmpU